MAWAGARSTSGRRLQEILVRYDEQFSGPVDVSTVFDPSFADALYDDDGELR